MTERNAAMSQILTQGTTGVYPNVVLNYDDILLAQGPLSAGTGIMVSENAGKVHPQK